MNAKNAKKLREKAVYTYVSTTTAPTAHRLKTRNQEIEDSKRCADEKNEHKKQNKKMNGTRVLRVESSGQTHERTAQTGKKTCLL